MDMSINASDLTLNSPYGFIRDERLLAQLEKNLPTNRLLEIAKPDGDSVASYVNNQSLYRGSASLSIDGRALVVRQMATAHRELLMLCEKLRVARGLAVEIDCQIRAVIWW